MTPMFQSPQGLAMDAEEFLYASDTANNRIYKLEAVHANPEGGE